MDVEKEETQSSTSIEKSLESNEIDYEKFESIYDPILEMELTTHFASSLNMSDDYEEEDEVENDENEESSVFTQRLWNSFLQKIKS